MAPKVTARPEPGPEFSRLVAPDRLGAGPLCEEIAAGDEERAALAHRFGLSAVERLSARLRLERVPDKPLVRLSGRFAARVTQSCVVSLEPVHSHIEESFSQLYTLEPTVAQQGEVVVEPAAEEPPEPVGAEGIDLGEAVAQRLALAIEPYPRAPGARVPAEASGGRGERPDEGPFAALKSLKRAP